MAFPSQFSLSLELTSLLPLGAVAEAGAKSLIQLTRDLRKSGSDIVIEEDLAAIFGRNRIQAQFESSFRTAVRDSSIVQIPSLIDIVLEAGAGPTVRRSIKNKAYLATVIQLSLLGYTHNIYILAKALIKALELRAEGSDCYNEIPDHDGLIGTLGAIRDQSTGYRWDLVFSAVENHISNGNEQHNHVSELRRLPFVVLQALLDAFTAIQHFPEQRLLRLRATSGISTIVVWAYHVLGLSTSVSYKSQPVARFGSGLEQISIEWLDADAGYGLDDVTLLSATDTKQVDFLLSANPLDDVTLHSFCRHAVSGYGISILRCEDVHTVALQRDLAHLVLALCVKVARQAEEDAGSQLTTAGYRVPASRRILWVGEMLFPDILGSHTAIEAISTLSCLDDFGWSDINLPQNILHSVRLFDEQCPRRRPPSVLGHYLYFPTLHQTYGEFKTAPALFLYPVVASLCRLVFALSTITNLPDCGLMPLDLTVEYEPRFPGRHTLGVRVLTSREAFEYLASLFYGRSVDGDAETRQATLISQNGWSLMLGTLLDAGPGNVPCGLTVHRGVPARNQERRNCIVDVMAKGEVVPIDATAGHYQVEHRPGDAMRLESAFKIRETKPLVGTSYVAFEVMRRLEILQNSVPNKVLAYVKTGFREMQQFSWDAVRVPACPHRSKPGEIIDVPDGCVAFSGWWTRSHDDREQPLPWDPNVPIHMALVAGSEPARWATLFGIAHHLWRWDGWEGMDKDPVSYIRPPSCCVACASEVAKKDRSGFPKILVL